MATDKQIEKARKVLSVLENADSNELKSAYIQKVNSLLESQHKMPYEHFLKYLDELNSSLQILVNVGFKNASQFDFFTFSVNPSIGESDVSRDSRPRFHFDC